MWGHEVQIGEERGLHPLAQPRLERRVRLVVLRAGRRDMVRWLEQAVEDAEIKAGLDLEAIVKVLSSAVYGAIYSWLLDPEQIDLKILLNDIKTRLPQILS